MAWPDHWVSSSIAQKEFVPIIIAAAIWDPHWQACHVCFHSNNMAMVSVLDKKATSRVRMTQLHRTLFFYAAIYKFYCWKWWWERTQTGACRIGSSCSGALCSGPLLPHSRHLLVRHKAVLRLLPASASPTSPSFRSHIVPLCV